MSEPSIADRRAAVGLTTKELAIRANVHEQVAGRVERGDRNHLQSTVERVKDALVERELEVLERLVGLHPQAARVLVLGSVALEPAS